MTKQSTSGKKKRKKSSVRHTRAIQFDKLKQPIADNLPEHAKTLFHEIIHPLTMSQVSHFHQLGLRERTLTLPVMVAVFLMAVWRQISGVSELARLIQDEAAIWEEPTKVSQQALAERLKTLPSVLVLNILNALLPLMQQRWEQRHRPLPPEIQWVQNQYSEITLADGSTLDALIKKVGLLRDETKHPLAGKMTGLLHLGSQLPKQIWYKPASSAQDQTFWDEILEAVIVDSLLIFDLGYTNFAYFLKLTAKKVAFITRAKKNLAYEVSTCIAETPFYRDSIVWIGKDETRQQVRLIEVLHGNKWRRYLTNELDVDRLPARECVALYHQRWSIERAFFVVKRLLGLAYFWSGAQNAVEFQLWSIWMVYTILIDLTDEVASLMRLPFNRISIEMVYRSMYYYCKAVKNGSFASLPAFLVERAKHLGIVKRKRKTNVSVYENWGLT